MADIFRKCFTFNFKHVTEKTLDTLLAVFRSNEEVFGKDDDCFKRTVLAMQERAALIYGADDPQVQHVENVAQFIKGYYKSASNNFLVPDDLRISSRHLSVYSIFMGSDTRDEVQSSPGMQITPRK